MDNLEFTVCILLDLSKAFVILNRDILIKGLEYYGIQGVAKLWFVIGNSLPKLEIPALQSYPSFLEWPMGASSPPIYL